MTLARRQLLSALICRSGKVLAGVVLLAMVAAQAAQAQTLTVLHNFDLRADGGAPYAGVTLDQQGRIYGTTSDGGTRNGVVFKLTRSGSNWSESVLWNFSGGSDGGVPESGVIFDSEGNLYGTTAFGSGSGTVYQLSPSQSGWTEKTLYTFTGRDNGNASGGLVIDAAGNLFGLTGDMGPGEAYELSPQDGNWVFTRLQYFSGAYPGPIAAPTLDSQGNLYGSLPSGGFGGGEIFELARNGSGWSYFHFHDFQGNEGEFPLGGVTLDGNGNMYGTTADGGTSGWGTVWKITP